MKKKLYIFVLLQGILVERFSKNNELEELHKHLYLIYIERFHEAKRKAQEEAAGMNHGHAYRARSEIAHLRAESSWTYLVED
ncbi:hypothetical protein M9H77_26534 [Catharanthus roseus]|uniref:Uncharacterized protein n=1 Tax=Catharanthus roseus TaxID=4058 RepID=A0ACC0AAY7_CATRO|nr:hypothetical protein M9H77_26534 [Catharanthus roseus]